MLELGRAAYRQNRWLVWLGLFIGVALLVLAAGHLHWRELRDALREARLFPWTLLAGASYLAGHFVRGARTRRLVSREAQLDLPAATNVVVLGYAVNNILPARLGELARAGMLAERTGLPVTQALTVTLLERVLDGWVLLFLLGLTAVFAPLAGWMRETFWIAALVFAVASFGILYALAAPNHFIGLTSRLAERLPAHWHDRAIRLAIAVTLGLAYLRRPRDAAGVLLLSLAVWLLEAGMFLLLLPAFHLSFNLWWALLALTVTNLGILAPSTPGFIGPFHYFCMNSLAAVGVAEATAMSYAIVVHLTFFAPITLWGVGIIFWYGLQLGSTIAMAQAAKRVPAAEA